MPRFYFHLHDGTDQRDEEGTCFPDLAAAQIAAVQLGGAMLRDHATAFCSQRAWRFDLTDSHGRPLCELRFEVSGSRRSAAASNDLGFAGPRSARS